MSGQRMTREERRARRGARGTGAEADAAQEPDLINVTADDAPSLEDSFMITTEAESAPSVHAGAREAYLAFYGRLESKSQGRWSAGKRISKRNRATLLERAEALRDELAGALARAHALARHGLTFELCAMQLRRVIDDPGTGPVLRLQAVAMLKDVLDRLAECPVESASEKAEAARLAAEEAAARKKAAAEKDARDTARWMREAARS